jgi:CHAD domain-containing protein
MPPAARRRRGDARDRETAREIERKLDVTGDFVMPDLTAVPGVTGVGTARVDNLDAIYYDTADRALLRRRIALRRRTGGPDAGWHLKRQTGADERSELRLPAGRAGLIPAQLQAEIAAVVRGATVAPVARVRNHRLAHPVLGMAGQVLAEIAVDDVTALRPAAGAGRWTGGETWHEVEVELVEGELTLLGALVDVLVANGATPSPHASKLGRALGVSNPDGAGSPSRRSGRQARDGEAAAELHRYLARQFELILSWDPQVRTDQPDAVHQLRVAARRIRSALATFRPLLDEATARALNDELRLLGRHLAPARDTEVIHAKLRAELAGLTELTELTGLTGLTGPAGDAVIGPIAARIDETFDARYRVAHDAAVAALDDPQYFAVLDHLEAVLADPPWRAEARRSADRLLPELLARSGERVRRAHRHAAGLDGAARDEGLHEVRKLAKRTRYSAEVLRHRQPKQTRAWVTGMTQLQEVLGEQHDSVVITAELLALAGAAQAAGEPSFGYGVLYQRERDRGAAAEAGYAAAWREARAVIRPSSR